MLIMAYIKSYLPFFTLFQNFVQSLNHCIGNFNICQVVETSSGSGMYRVVEFLRIRPKYFTVTIEHFSTISINNEIHQNVHGVDGYFCERYSNIVRVTVRV